MKRKPKEVAFAIREQQRQIALKTRLFSAEACEPGTYEDKLTPVCLRDHLKHENLHASSRNQALEYFDVRGISWHSMGHLTSSQSCCVNIVFPFFQRPDLLKSLLEEIGYSVQEVLPFEFDFITNLKAAGWKMRHGDVGGQSTPHHIAFEWIGAKNYLKELWGKNVCGDTTRTRGGRFSSVDFAIRFRRNDGRIQIVLIEWKYTESYTKNRSKRFSDSKTDRLERIYRKSLEREDCQIQLPSGIQFEDLFFDPFDQMMRHQLLASAMECAHEMSADIVSYLHVAPRSNAELVNRITSPKLKDHGDSIYEVWHYLVAPDRFHHCFLEDFVRAATKHAPDESWSDFVRHRYGRMETSELDDSNRASH